VIYWLFFSVTISALLLLTSVFIVRKALQSQAFVDDVFLSVSKFREHLQSIYELEIFYGDETLNELLSHARDLELYLSENQMFLSLSEGEVEKYVNQGTAAEEEAATPPDL
tara:strand:+ start:515 stop:847 length:333 start_codon:yes stop_codon:yes gene_type:complete